MSSQYVEISKQEFDNALPPKGCWVEAYIGNEVVYTMNIPNLFVLKVYSSITHQQTARDVGKDAIRFVFLDYISQKPFAKKTRINRTENWEKRLVKKIDEFIINAGNFIRCRVCLSAKGINQTYCKVCQKDTGNVERKWLRFLGEPFPYSIEDLAKMSVIDDPEPIMNHMKKYFNFKHNLAWLKSELNESEYQKRMAEQYLSVYEEIERIKTDELWLERFWQIWCADRNIDESRLMSVIKTLKNNCYDRISPKPIEFDTEVIEHRGITEKLPAVKTDSFEHMKWDFEHFNPMQSECVQYINTDSNMVVAAPTASGKTVIAEMIISHLFDTSEKTAVYLAPMRALAEEKINDFKDKNHKFSQFNQSIMTGDYQMTNAKQKEVENAKIIIMTNEMLATRARMYKSEKNEWIHNIGALIVDEAHLLGVAERGDSTEAALMNFTKINPSCRIVLLSATIPNCEDLAKWLQVLNHKETVLIESDYRPCVLNKIFKATDYAISYSMKQLKKVDKVVEILENIGYS